MAMDIRGLHVPNISSLKDLDENGMPKENWEEKDRIEQLDEPGVPEETKQSADPGAGADGEAEVPVTDPKDLDHEGLVAARAAEGLTAIGPEKKSDRADMFKSLIKLVKNNESEELFNEFLDLLRKEPDFDENYIKGE